MRSPTPRRRALLSYVSIAAVTLSMALTACSGASPGTSVQPTPATSAASTPGPTPDFVPPSAVVDDFEGADTADDTAYRPDDWQEHQWPGDWRETKPAPVTSPYRTVKATYQVQGGVSLREGWFRGSDSWHTRDANVDTVESKASFAVNGTSPAFMYRHRIYDDGKPTEFWLGTKFGSPQGTGSNQWNCEVFRGDPAGEGEWAWVSPYVCNWSDVRGFNPEPVLTVKKATLVTNKRDAKDLLSTVCNASDGQRRCRYFNVGFGKGIGERQVVGSVLVNPGTAKGTKTVKWSEKNGTTNSAGVEISAGFKIGKIFSFEVTAHYSHEWLWEHTFGDETEIDLESGTAQWVEYAAPYQTSIGNWVVESDKGTFLVPDITFKTPVVNGGRTYVVTCPIEELNDDNTCNVQPLSKLVKR